MFQVYKSSSKRKAHILKYHPGQDLPLSVRGARADDDDDGEVSLDRPGEQLPRRQEQTFSATVGSVTSQPHRCRFCHKQYASNAKLLQHYRKKHREKLPKDQQVGDNPQPFDQAVQLVPQLSEDSLI